MSFIVYKGFGYISVPKISSYEAVDSMSKKCIIKQEKKDMTQEWRTYRLYSVLVIVVILSKFFHVVNYSSIKLVKRFDGLGVR